MSKPLDPEIADLKARYYRWWTVFAWRDEYSSGVKLGPFTLFWYRWLDGGLRVSVTLPWGEWGREHIIFGGPL